MRSSSKREGNRNLLLVSVAFALVVAGLYWVSGGRVFSLSSTPTIGLLFGWLVFPTLWRYLRAGIVDSTGVLSPDFVTAVIRFPIALGFLIYGSITLCGNLIAPAAPFGVFGIWTGTKAMVALRKLDNTRVKR